ncbi:MAG TPA: hypothetical protein V6D15_24460 [Oculatellaceae cyanobacterium]|jgi:hypothetical protein
MPGKGVKSQQDKIATSSESNNLNISRNVNELKKYITLPYSPQAVVWLTEIKGSNTSTVPGPTDWSLTAVLTFRPEDAKKIVSASSLASPAVFGTVELMEWFPPDVKAQVLKDPSTKQYTIKGKMYSANAFYKLSLINGFLLQLDKTSQFILVLYTM